MTTMTNDSTPVRAVFTTDYTEDHIPYRFTATAAYGPHWFTVGAEVRNLTRRGDNAIEACGCLHEETATRFPELAPIIALHLCGRDGAPMHAEANARYWFGMSRWSNGEPMNPCQQYDNPDLYVTDTAGTVWSPHHVANHLRITIDDAHLYRAALLTGKTTIPDLIAMFRERWQTEADNVYKFIKEHANA